jgi:hypothetical protein
VGRLGLAGCLLQLLLLLLAGSLTAMRCAASYDLPVAACLRLPCAACLPPLPRAAAAC